MINFDYSSNNLYFVTSCTYDSIHYFGEIKNGKMHLNEIGDISLRQWEWLTEQYPYIKSHAFVVMPNHIHGILEINRDFIVRTKITSISELMGAYKTTTSKKIHMAGYHA
jgi:putative transposase